jgi:hypothetical protein
MMPYVVKVPRARVLGLSAIAAAAFVLAFAATQVGRSAAGSPGDAPGQQIESSAGVPDSLSAVGAIPVLAQKPAPPPPSPPQRPANQTSTSGAAPVSGIASRPSAPAASTPSPAPAAPQAATPKAAPAPAPGASFDESG